MVKRRFALDAAVDSDAPAAVERVLLEVFPGGVVREAPGRFRVRGEMEGENSKELNRTLLSTLRRAERKTRIRAEWTSEDGTVERFFDYVLKKTVRGGRDG